LLAVCLAALIEPALAPVARAADKPALACIRAAEDGQAARDANQFLRARELFAVCAAPECPAVLRKDCTSWLEEVKRRIPSIVVSVRDRGGHDVLDAQASIDGVVRQRPLDGRAIELDPGLHSVRVEAAQSEPIETKVVLGAGEKDRPILVTLGAPQPSMAEATPARATPAPPSSGEAQSLAPLPEQPAPHKTLPLATYLLGGAAVVAMGVFGYFGIRGLVDANHLRGTCAPGCAPARVDGVEGELRAADIALGVGTLSLAGAMAFAIWGSSSAGRTAAVPLEMSPRSSSLEGHLVLRF
jgi:hypothetical protein